jgi:hypothetical protein
MKKIDLVKLNYKLSRKLKEDYTIDSEIKKTKK